MLQEQQGVMINPISLQNILQSIKDLSPIAHTYATSEVHATAPWHAYVTPVHWNYYNAHISDMLLEVCKMSGTEEANSLLTCVGVGLKGKSHATWSGKSLGNHTCLWLLGTSQGKGLNLCPATCSYPAWQSGKNCQITALYRQLAPPALDHIGLFF